ncbi:hypothetical protein TSUD_414610, partial [Trifolium subterraneum]
MFPLCSSICCGLFVIHCGPESSDENHQVPQNEIEEVYWSGSSSSSESNIQGSIDYPDEESSESEVEQELAHPEDEIVHEEDNVSDPESEVEQELADFEDEEEDADDEEDPEEQLADGGGDDDDEYDDDEEKDDNDEEDDANVAKKGVGDPLDHGRKKKPKQWRSDASLSSILDEPCSLGLSLKNNPSLLDLAQMAMVSLMNMVPANDSRSKKESRAPAKKPNATNFSATLLKTGSWEVAKHPKFYMEADSQPRKSKTWQETTDFIGGQAIHVHASMSTGKISRCLPSCALS